LKIDIEKIGLSSVNRISYLVFFLKLLFAIYLANYLHSRHPAEDVHLVDRIAVAYSR